MGGAGKLVSRPGLSGGQSGYHGSHDGKNTLTVSFIHFHSKTPAIEKALPIFSCNSFTNCTLAQESRGTTVDCDF